MRRRCTKHEKELGAGSQRQWHRHQKELIPHRKRNVYDFPWEDPNYLRNYR